jgi:type VI protein secretion system component VasK
MFKLIRRLIAIAIITAIVFLALSLWQGGKPFRWFGKKSEQAGEVLKKKSEEVGDEADKIKKRSEDVKDTSKKVGDTMKKTKEKIKNISGFNENK